MFNVSRSQETKQWLLADIKKGYTHMFLFEVFRFYSFLLELP